MGLTITKVNCPSDKIGVKCPYYMTPTRIVVHNTANNASAMNEVSYMLNNYNEVSYHFAVDYERAVQGIGLNRNAWHAGDGGNGAGNRYGIAIEICYSTGNLDNFLASEKNGAILVAMLLKQYGWGIDKVTKHQDYSGKYCPHKTLDLGWQRFLNMVSAELNGETAPSTPEQPSTPPTGSCKYEVGTSVCTNTLATSSTGGKVYKGDWRGTITKVIAGTPYPYLLDNGTGWTNDTGIDTDPHSPSGESTTKPTAPSTGAKYSVGTPVCTNTLAVSSVGGKVYKGDWKGTITKVIPGAAYPYLLDNGTGWTNDTGIDTDPHSPSGGTTSASSMSARQFALEVWNKGMHGTGAAREAEAKRLGVSYTEVQRLINLLASGKSI